MGGFKIYLFFYILHMFLQETGDFFILVRHKYLDESIMFIFLHLLRAYFSYNTEYIFLSYLRVKKTQEKKKLVNIFFDLLSMLMSIFVSIFRSTVFFISWKWWRYVHKKYFFQILDFIFHLWPKDFWKKPSGYKFTRFIWDFFQYLFFKK